jgi:hypothetical protein
MSLADREEDDSFVGRALCCSVDPILMSVTSLAGSGDEVETEAADASQLAHNVDRSMLVKHGVICDWNSRCN